MSELLKNIIFTSEFQDNQENVILQNIDKMLFPEILDFVQISKSISYPLAIEIIQRLYSISFHDEYVIQEYRDASAALADAIVTTIAADMEKTTKAAFLEWNQKLISAGELLRQVALKVNK